MIPYDDLVAALNNWRTRQGLPVATGPSMTGSGPTAAPSVISTPASGPMASSGPARTAPPNAPPRAAGYQPPPLAMPEPGTMPETMPETMEDSLDVDDAALLEEAHYENEGGDFAMNFGAPVENDAESTTLGHAPDAGNRDSFGGETDFDPKSRKPW
jgi:hypothetical protein